MTLKKLLLTCSIVLVYFLSFTESKADLINPSSLIKPKEVIKIQLSGLMKNDDQFKDIEKAFLEYQVLFFQNQNEISPELHLKFGKLFNI